MEEFNKISIQEMSKQDMFIILNALDIAAQHTKKEEYRDLKDHIMEQLCKLANCNEEEFLVFLKS